MSMSIHCPECKKPLKLPEELLGQTVKCPSCQTKFTASAGEVEAPSTAVSPKPPLAAAPTEPEWSEPELMDEDEEEPRDREGRERPRRRRKRRKVSPVQSAESAVFLPAIGLMIIGGVGIVATIGLLILIVLGGAAAGAEGRGGSPSGGGPGGGKEAAAAGMAFGLMQGCGQAIAGVIWSGVILLGGINMKNLADYRMALAASIVSMLPCNICCFFGLPVGIWSLIILLQPNVRNNFA